MGNGTYLETVKTMKSLKLKAGTKITQWWALNCLSKHGGWEDAVWPMVQAHK